MSIDTDGARELILFAENDANLYRQRFTPIVHNLQKKLKKGIYDKAKAVKLWLSYFDDAAARYNKEFGDGTLSMKLFNKETRLVCAKEMEATVWNEWEVGNYWT